MFHHRQSTPNTEVLRPYIVSRGDVVSIFLRLSGLKCGQCTRKVQELLCTQRDIVDHSSSLDGKDLRIDALGPQPLTQIIAKIQGLGFGVLPVAPSGDIDEQVQEHRRQLKALAVAGVCAGNVMFFSVAVYLGATKGHKEFFLTLSMLLSLPSLVYSSRSIFAGLIRGLQYWSFNLDVPIGLALLFGYGLSFVNYLSGLDGVYFDSLTMVVFLILLSRFLLQSGIARVTSCGSGAALPGGMAARVVDHQGAVKDIATLDVTKAHRVLVRKGEVFPVDGRIRSSTAIVDNSFLTGESEPVTLLKGQLVFAGSRCCFGQVEVSPLQVGSASRIGRLIETSRGIFQKAKGENLKWVSRFTFGVLLASVGVLLYFFLNGFYSEGFRRAFAMVIIACPCAVTFGFPLIRFSASQWALNHHILLRSPEVLPRLAGIQEVVFDKTGTLTSSVMKVCPASFDDLESQDCAAIMALESQIDHPIAWGVLAHNRFSELPEVEDFDYLPGVGIEGRVGGEYYQLLSSAPDGEDANDGNLRRDGKPLFIYKNSVAIGQIWILPEIRSSAKALFKFLESQAIGLSVLSGDTLSQVEKIWHWVPRSIRRHCRAEASPEDKANFVRRLQGPVMMVGDGMNDVLAMKTAALGVAMPGALEDTLNTSQVVILKNDLQPVQSLFLLAKKMVYAEKLLFSFTCLYNLGTVTLAALGFIGPVSAAILMPVSSAIVFAIVFWNLGRSVWK